MHLNFCTRSSKKFAQFLSFLLIILVRDREKNKIPFFMIVASMDYGHPERAFFQKLETFGLGQTFGLKFYEAFGVFLANL